MREVIRYWAVEFGTLREGLSLALNRLRPSAVLGALAGTGRRTAAAACVLCGRSTPPGREAFRVADLVACRHCQGET